LAFPLLKKVNVKNFVCSSAEHKATLQNMAKPIPKMSFSEIGEGLKNIDMSLSLGKALALSHSLFVGCFTI
jgi:hypothetical protein